MHSHNTMNKKVKPPYPSSSSAETVLTNNIYVLTEILLRVPATSLLKLKSVSKQWLSLISNPEFRLSHTRLHLIPNFTTPSALFLDIHFTGCQIQLFPLKNDVVSSKITSFDYLNAGAADVEIEQSCNGLLLCSYDRKVIDTVDIFPGKHFCPTLYFICNPTTKQFKKVKFPERFSSGSYHGAVILAFDPSKSPNYNLLSLRSPCKTKWFQFDIYSSETDAWCPLEINILIPPDDEFMFSSAIYCRGAIHWPPTYKGTSLYFDVETRVLKQMPKPPSYDRGVLGHQIVRYFGECGGRLQLVMGVSAGSLEFDVLEMALDYSKWLVRYHVHLHSSVPSAFLSRKAFSILSVVCGEKEEDAMVVIFVNGVVLAYNLCHDGTPRKLCEVKPWYINGSGWSDRYWRCTFRYYDTLFWF